MSRFLIALFLGFGFLSALPVTAARATDLTLAQSIDSARRFWEDKLGESLVESQLALRIAQGSLLPSLAGNYTVGRDFSSPLAPVGQGSLTLKQDLVNAANWKTIEARSAEVVSRACDQQEQLLVIAKNVIHLFFQIRHQEEQARLLKKNAGRLAKVVELLEETVQLKVASQTDLFSAKAEVSDVQLLLAQSQADMASTSAQFKSQVGISVQDSLNLSGVPEISYRPPEMRDWLKLAETLPDIISLRSRVISSIRDASAANWESVPTFSVQAAYGNPSFGSPPGTPNYASVVGTFSLPILDQGIRTKKHSRAESLRTLFEGQLTARRNSTLNEIEALLSQRNADQSVLQIANERLRLAEQAYANAWTLLRLGRGGYLSIKDAENSAFLAEGQKATILIRLATTLATLRIVAESAKTLATGEASGCRSIPDES